MRITKMTVGALSWRGETLDLHFDDTLPGFGVRVYPSGLKSYIVRYYHRGRRRIVTIGSTDLLMPEEARTRARTMLLSVLDGENPRGRGILFKEFADIWLKRHALPRKKSGKLDKRRVEQYLVPQFGNAKLDDLTIAQVSRWHSDMFEIPYQANRCLENLKTMYNCARKWGYLPDKFENPVQDVQPFPEVSRDRFLTAEELIRVADVTMRKCSAKTGAAIMLLLFTGLRKREVTNLQWKDVDFHRKEFRAVAKNSVVRYVPMSDPIYEMLRVLPRSGSRVTTGVKAVDTAWRIIRKLAGVPDVRIHDLRRTLGSWMAHDGAAMPLIADVLGQTTQHSTSVYTRFKTGHVREALERHASRLISLGVRTTGGA